MEKKKVEGKDIPEDEDELLIQLANQQLRVDYRRSLGKEYARRSWDVEIKKIFKEKD